MEILRKRGKLYLTLAKYRSIKWFLKRIHTRIYPIEAHKYSPFVPADLERYSKIGIAPKNAFGCVLLWATQIFIFWASEIGED